MMIYIKAAMSLLGATGVVGKLIAAGVLAVTLLGLYGAWHHRVYRSGVNDTLAKIAAADAKMVARALDMRKALNECKANGRGWDQSTGRCQ